MAADKLHYPTTKRGTATHQKVIAAGIECIASQGFHNTSTNKIAKAAGVTWGTLQHQFGDKARLLEAILETCFEHQMQQIKNASHPGTPLVDRVDVLVETIWQNQQTDINKAMQEILLNVRSDQTLSKRFFPTLQKLRDLYDKQWCSIFNDFNVSTERMEATKQLTFAALRGLSFDVVVQSETSTHIARGLLKKVILDTLYQHRQPNDITKAEASIQSLNHTSV